METDTNDDRVLNSIVQEVIREAHLNLSLILPEEIGDIRRHALRKPLGVTLIWGLGVGAVIAGRTVSTSPIAEPSRIECIASRKRVVGTYARWRDNDQFSECPVIHSLSISRTVAHGTIA